MRLFKYGKSHGWRMAVTIDADGTNLPTESRPWIPFGTVDIEKEDGPRIGVDSDVVIAGVEKDGFFILPGNNDPDA